MQSGGPLHIWVVVGSRIECISTSTSFPFHKGSAKVKKSPRDPRHAESFALLQGRRFQIHGWHISYMRSRAKRFGLLLPRQWNHRGIDSRMVQIKSGHSMQLGDPLQYGFVIGSPMEFISTDTPLPCQKGLAQVKEKPRDSS